MPTAVRTSAAAWPGRTTRWIPASPRWDALTAAFGGSGTRDEVDRGAGTRHRLHAKGSRKAPPGSPALLSPTCPPSPTCSRRDAVDELVSRRGLRTPFLRVAQDGRTLARPRLHRRAAASAPAIADQVSDDKLLRLFADGRDPRAAGRCTAPGRRVVDFAQELAAELGHPVQVNAYVTPRAEHAASATTTTCTTSSCCRWPARSAGSITTARASSRRCATSRGPTTAPPCEAGRQAPPAHRRRARAPATASTCPAATCTPPTALGGVSIHLTIGVHLWTRRAPGRRAAPRRACARPRGLEIRAPSRGCRPGHPPRQSPRAVRSAWCARCEIYRPPRTPPRAPQAQPSPLR